MSKQKPAVTFASIVEAINMGRYVIWEGQWSSGVVLAIESPECVVMQSENMGYKPFNSGFAQAQANGYEFSIKGESVEDFAS
jgi:hypothetical protein